MRKDIVIGLGLAVVAGIATAFKKHADEQEVKADNKHGYGLEIIDHPTSVAAQTLEVSGYQ